VAAGFRRDQGRDKGFGGPALGPAAAAAIARIFGARGFTVESAASDWVVRGRGGPAEPALRGRTAGFLAELVAGHAEAAARQDRRGAARVAAWREARLAQVGERRLSVRIGHRDVLAVPGAAERR
jgi:hypothetical protein